jgi:hypothetical protein
MIRDEALFLNGIYETVLDDILKIQGQLPEHIMYLQPYSSSPIVHLRDDRPSTEYPVLLYISITTDLPMVRYTAEIAGWDDKRQFSEKRKNILNHVINTLQPGETGLYDASRVQGKSSVNLLHIWRLQRMAPPFSVSRLIKTVDGSPVSPKRTTAGGWAYVKKELAPQDG